MQILMELFKWRQHRIWQQHRIFLYGCPGCPGHWATWATSFFFVAQCSQLAQVSQSQELGQLGQVVWYGIFIRLWRLERDYFLFENSYIGDVFTSLASLGIIYYLAVKIATNYYLCAIYRCFTWSQVPWENNLGRIWALHFFWAT